MGAEVVLHEHDPSRLRKMRVGQLLQHRGVIQRGAVVGDFDVAPAFQRGEHHEQIGGAVACILVVVPGRASWPSRDRHAGLADQLLRGLVEANHPVLRIMRPLIDLEHVFHAGYEGGISFGRDDPLLLKMRLERVFLSVRPIVLSLARATMFSSITAVSNNCSVHRERPLGGSEQASAISLASATPSKTRFLADRGECLRVSAASTPPSTNCWRVRATVSMLVSSASAISLSLHPSPASHASAFSRMRAFSTWRAGRLPVWISAVSCCRSSTVSATHTSSRQAVSRSRASPGLPE